ncbi:MAG: LacI family DNA-binding transcriptional regulator [Thermomicrobiales bacterium]
MARRVTIEDVARESNASVSTVSLVLRNKPGIGAETRRRVLETAQALGYRRQSPAPVTAPGTRNIGLILRARARSRDVGPSVVNAFYSWVVSGIDAAAQQARLNLLYASLAVDDDNRLLDLPRHLLDQALDGVLLVGAFTDEAIAELAGVQARPVVLVDAPARLHRYDAVVSDNEGGAYTAVAHLITQGHRRIALAGPGSTADPNFNERREGYRRALREHGLASYPLAQGETHDAADDNAAAAMLRQHPEVTAIFGCNDTFALSALRALRLLGWRVPEDVSVIGFDDIERSGQTTPPLTTMAVDKVSMGRLAVQMLLFRLAWPDAAPTLTMLQPRLVERQSVRPPAATPPQN